MTKSSKVTYTQKTDNPFDDIRAIFAQLIITNCFTELFVVKYLAIQYVFRQPELEYRPGSGYSL
jgi:hypothetical protein